MEVRRLKALKTSLEALNSRYQGPRALDADPLTIPLSFEDPWDRELTAWIAAHLAYGRVAPMQRAIRKVLTPLGPTPSAWLRSTNSTQVREALKAALPG